MSLKKSLHIDPDSLKTSFAGGCVLADKVITELILNYTENTK